jgi:tellurite resistance protein TerC
LDNALLWIGFAAVIVVMLALDLGVFHRKAHRVPVREAAAWSLVWFSLAMIFAAGVFLQRGATAGMEFLTGYLIELSLSVDNVFLFAVIFGYFQVPSIYQHRVLFWGILSAVIMRGLMIVAGAALIRQFHWIIWVFGAFLILTGIKMFLHRNREADVSESSLIRFLKRRLRFTDEYDGQRFFTRRKGLFYATPLFLVLALVEFTDIMFAVDSIPAIFAITTDPFIVFTSNIFAILGLRSLYFLLSGVMDKFYYLKVGLSAILVFVGFKMLGLVKIPIAISLGVVIAILGVAILASALRSSRLHRQESEAVNW